MLELLILIFSITATVTTGFFVYAKNPKSDTHRIFTLLAIAFAGWTGFSYLPLHVQENQLLFIRLTMFFVVLMNTALFFLVQVFPHTKLQLTKLRIGLIIYAVLVLAITQTPLLFSDLSIDTNGGLSPVPAPGIALFLIHAVIFALGTPVLLIRRFLKSSGLERVQLRYILYSTIAFFTLVPLTNFVLPLAFGNSQLIVYSPLYTMAFSLVTAYAIVRQRLFDIRFIVARSVGYALLLVTLAGLYGLGTFALSDVFLTLGIAGGNQLLIYVSLAIVLAFTFQPLQRYFTKLTDRIFFKDLYDPQELLSDLSHIMAVNFQLEPLLTLLLSKTVDVMRLTRGAFVLTDQDKIYLTKTFGYNFNATWQSKDLKSLRELGKTIIYDELEEGPTKDLLRNYGAGLAAPLIAEKEFVGFLFLGEKRSGDIYSEQDLRLIGIIAPEISVAIANAKAVDKIERFNITLKEEVDQATKELRSANAELKRLDELKDEFFSIATHELRTPLTAIRGNAQLIEEYFGAKIKDKDFKEMLSAIEVNSDRLVNIVAEYLNMSRLEQGRMKFAFAQVDVAALANELTHDLEGSLSSKGLALKVEGSAPKAWADADKVKEVLINLVGNAIKFTDKGGITVRVSSDSDGVETQVIDTGEGIPKKNQMLLFKKYQQAGKDSLTKVDKRGTGLGLYISKLMIEAMKGRVWLESSVEGKGSTFAFTLPIATGKEKAEAEELKLPALSKE